MVLEAFDWFARGLWGNGRCRRGDGARPAKDDINARFLVLGEHDAMFGP